MLSRTSKIVIGAHVAVILALSITFTPSLPIADARIQVQTVQLDPPVQIQKPEKQPEKAQQAQTPEIVAVAAKPEPKPESRPEPKPVEKKPEPKPVEKKPPPKPVEKAKPKEKDKTPEKPKPKAPKEPELTAQQKKVLESLEKDVKELDIAPSTKQTAKPASNKPAAPAQQQTAEKPAADSSYEEMLAATIKGHMHLPEYGEVRVNLTLARSGKVVKVEILEASSQINKIFVQKELAQLLFAEFGEAFGSVKSKTFQVVLGHEI